jgi:hypothetical protein
MVAYVASVVWDCKTRTICQDSLLMSSKVGLDDVLELEVIDVEDKVREAEAKEAKDKGG